MGFLQSERQCTCRRDTSSQRRRALYITLIRQIVRQTRSVRSSEYKNAFRRNRTDKAIGLARFGSLARDCRLIPFKYMPTIGLSDGLGSPKIKEKQKIFKHEEMATQFSKGTSQAIGISDRSKALGHVVHAAGAGVETLEEPN